MTNGVAIIGYGHVGKAMHQIFPQAQIYDKYNDQYQNTKSKVNSCGLGIVCVPTPEAEGGAVDTTIVEEVVSWLETPLIVIKSTVPPGTTDRLRSKYKKRVTMSPEYFGESPYWQSDMFTPMGWPFMIVGGAPEDTRAVTEFFLPRLGPNKVYRQTTARTAELVKYMENAWLSAQVTFANEFYGIAQASDVDYLELRELWALDPRVSRSHTAVFPDNRGFGGKCLPKDINGLIASSRDYGYDPTYLAAIWEANIRFRSLHQGQ